MKCPKCKTIGEWNWAKEREELTMPNGIKTLAKVPVKGEPAVKCPNCHHTFEPYSHKILETKLRNLSIE